MCIARLQSPYTLILLRSISTMSIYSSSIRISQALGVKTFLISDEELLDGLGYLPDSTIPPWNKGKQLEDWDRQKKSISRKRYLDRNPEAKKKLKEFAKKGSINSGIKSSKKYIITFPDGHEEKIVGLKAFCKKHNLNQGNMCSVANGKLKSYKGFHVRFC